MLCLIVVLSEQIFGPIIGVQNIGAQNYDPHWNVFRQNFSLIRVLSLFEENIFNERVGPPVDHKLVVDSQSHRQTS